jgi:hypothetical protein
VTPMLSALAGVAESGMAADCDAVRVLMAAAVRLSGSMNPGQVAHMLWGVGRLAKSGVAMDAAALRAFTDAAIRVSVDMKLAQVHMSLTAFVNLAESGRAAPLDPVAVRALRDAAARVADDMTDAQRTETLAALAKLTGLGSDAGPATGARAPSGALSPSAAETTTRAAFAPNPHSLSLAAAADPWLSVLPSGKRATLELQLDAEATPRAKWEVLRRSADLDTTKARAPARRAILLRVEEEAVRLATFNICFRVWVLLRGEGGWGSIVRGEGGGVVL